MSIVLCDVQVSSAMLMLFRASCWAALTLTVLHSAAAGELATIPRLYEHLMTDYKRVRPRIDGTSPVVVSVDVIPVTILDLNGRTGVLTIYLDFKHVWEDDFLVWDPAEFNMTKFMTLAATSIWLPDLGVYNSVSRFAGDKYASIKEYPVQVTSAGRVNWLYSMLVEASCQINMDRFPFDTQKCDIQYGTLSSISAFVDIQNGSAYVDAHSFVENGEFIVASNSVVPAIYVVDEQDTLTSVVITLELQRRPTYYVMNMLMPCAALSLIGVLSFCLPVAAGERVSLQVTMLLSFGIYQLMLSDYIPVNSLNIPIISKIILAMIVLCALSLVTNVVIIGVYETSPTQKMAKPVRWIIFSCLGKSLGYRPWSSKIDTLPDAETKPVGCVTNNVLVVKGEAALIPGQTDTHDQNESTDNRDGKPSSYSLEVQLLQEMLKEQKSMVRELQKMNEVKVDDKCASTEQQWKAAADILDRLFFIFFSVIFILLGCLTFTYGYI